MQKKSQFKKSEQIPNVFVAIDDDLTKEEVGLLNHLNAKEVSKWQWMKEDLAEREKKQMAVLSNVKAKAQAQT